MIDKCQEVPRNCYVSTTQVPRRELTGMAREAFGIIDTLKSGNIRARYTAPDGKRYAAPGTYKTKGAARVWLAARQAEIAAGTWEPPADVEAKRREAAQHAARRGVTLSHYAGRWITTRTNSRGEPLRTRTREEYTRLLRAAGTKNDEDTGGPLAPLLAMVISDITPERVRDWRSAQIATGTKTQTSRAYDLLKSIMKTAQQDGIIDANPCIVRGGSTTTTGKSVKPPTDRELATIIEAIRPEFKALVVVAAIGGLRFGEATALRAGDVAVECDDDGNVSCVRLTVQRGVVKTATERVVGATKSAAGVRSVAVYGDDAQIVAEHVENKANSDLVFPAADGVSYLAQTTFFRHWTKARAAAGRADMPFHALRHYAGTRYAQAGATVSETMARLGHSSVKAAMRYQHAGDRDDELAARLTRQS